MSKPKSTENIYSSAVVQALEQQYCSSCSAAVVSPCSSMGLGERVVSRIYNGGRQVVYTGAVTAMLLNTFTPPAYADLVVSADQTSTGLTVGSAAGNDVISRLYNYGITNSTTLNDGGTEYIESGGVAGQTIINSGGREIISANGSDVNAHIMEGGIQFVSSGAQTNYVKISSGGIQSVYQGAAVTNTFVYEGGSQVLATSANATNTNIFSGGEQILSGGDIAGGSALNTLIKSGGIQRVKDNAVASNTIISNGGKQILSGVIYSAASIRDTISSGGVQEVMSHGVAFSTAIHFSGTQLISQGGSAAAVDIYNGGEQSVLGGRTDLTNIHNGGVQHVSGGGIDSRAIVSSGGVQHISNGGSASYTSIYAGGTQYVSNGGSASYTSIYAGGTQYVSNGGNVSNVTNVGRVNLSAGGNLTNYTAAAGYSSSFVPGKLYVYGDNTLYGTTKLGDGTVILENSSPTTLTVQNLSANNAVFNMNVDLVEQTGDKLNITGSYNGNANLKLTNTAAVAAETTGDGIKLVDFSSGATVNGTFDLVGGQWDEGGYVYKLAQNSGDPDYYLRSTQEFTDTFKTMFNIPVMNAMIAQTGMNSLQLRLGDLRAMNNPDAKQGVWVRSYYKDMTVKDLAKTDMSLFGAEAGYDWLFRADEPTKLYAGVLVGFVSANSIKTEKNNGMYDKGDGQAPTVGVYATLINENGWFVDIAARNFWSKLDMKNHTSGGTELAYTPKRNVFAASVELGKSFNSELARDRFIRIEPKVELGYMNAAASDTKVGNTLNKIKYNAANYINAKAGVLLSYNAVRSNGLLIEPLLELAYRYEFDGKDKVTYGGATAESDLSGGAAEINAGLNMQLTDNLYWYGLGSYEASDKVKGWGVHAGIRYAFGDNKLAKAKQRKSKQLKSNQKKSRATVKTTNQRNNYSLIDEMERLRREGK